MTMQASSELNTRTGLTKVEQYKWVITGKQGELAYLPKAVLQIDHTYQRAAKNARVIKLAKRWNWLACGVLVVAKRGGRYYVVDGQHRLMAALKRSDIVELPCLIFESAEMREEAVAFRDANKERRPITAFEQWHADLVAGDEPTLFVNKLIESAGRTPAAAAKANTVRCLSSVVQAAREKRPELERVWPLAVELCAGEALHERVLGSLMYLECFSKDGQSVSDKRWRERVLKLGYQGVVNATASAAAFYSKGGPKVWALGVMEQLNKGLRSNLFSLRTDT